MRVWAIVVAAGRGDRFGGPKQYAPLDGRRVLDWSLDACRATCDGVVLVVPPERVGDPEPADAVVAGGATRADSVRSGLAAVPDDAEVIVVHDAARPWASPALFRAVVDAVHDGAVPALRLSDTVKRVEGDRVVETLDRATLVAVQTPQAFRADVLRKAHASGAEATDDAALVEQLGGVVVVVPGEPGNRKITHAGDV
ncbi:MAG TPA: 2-C-methyl-D-erythritol 4-phosphate cytidylyltransferase [Acidimicrobiales bacterium]|nr:2-C-methyl-D-erythritol 4-phosphate cytidylyltransferase [Acidimicrobiales bacterium]